jgi:KDO2-lipid IV(A) lauroyltransferase
MANRSTLRNVAEYLPARILASVVQCFPERRNLLAAAMAARCYATLHGRHRRRAEHNLRLSFPDKSAKEIRRIAVASIEHLFQLAGVDAMVMGRAIRPSTWHRHLDFEQARDAFPLLVSDRPALLLTGHCGNWELLGYGMSVVGYPISALARPLDNPLLNRWILGIREAWGLKVLTKWGATPIMQGILEDGGRLGFIADQNAGDQGIFVPFFGRSHRPTSRSAFSRCDMKRPLSWPWRPAAARGWTTSSYSGTSFSPRTGTPGKIPCTT